ncbi:hypothetical protein DFJ63DRAFT_314810 [Scheffersomyces coipomensis]|uniref:uncharacterized protein n=1 Tax=Scheffersomyces coipomensis TaxID=1788519 RepID=UPI00315DB9D5
MYIKELESIKDQVEKRFMVMPIGAGGGAWYRERWYLLFLFLIPLILVVFFVWWRRRRLRKQYIKKHGSNQIYYENHPQQPVTDENPATTSYIPPLNPNGANYTRPNVPPPHVYAQEQDAYGNVVPPPYSPPPEDAHIKN